MLSQINQFRSVKTYKTAPEPCKLAWPGMSLNISNKYKFIRRDLKVKKLLALVTAVILALSIAGCGSNTSETSATSAPENSTASTTAESAAPAKAVKIQFMHTMVEQERQQVIADMITDFQSKNPGITIEQLPTDEDSYDTKITALGGSGQLPALMEMSQNQAKQNAKNAFIDFDAVKQVIGAKGEASFFDGILNMIKTEDGANYTGVPVGGWVQGIWYNKEQFDAKGLKAPDTWENITAAAKAFSNPANKKYGIAMPTAKDDFTEQAFSQFALSNNANVLNADGKATFNTPEMIEALTYYKSLYQYTMPGSNDVTAVKDAFMNGSAAMAVYSTYMIPSLNEAGTMGKIGFAIPKNKTAAAFGNVGMITIKADMEANEKDAAIKFLNYLLTDEVNIKWLHMSPGGQQPVMKSVAGSSEYMNNPVIQSFAGIANDIASAFNSLQGFGSVNGKNFLVMGDISSNGVISDAVNRVTVKGEDPAAVAKDANAQIEELLQ